MGQHTPTKQELDTYIMVEKQILENSRTREKFPILKLLGSGTYGSIFSTSQNRVIKYLKQDNEKSFLTECAIQKYLSDHEPGCCPRLFEYGKRSNGKYVVVMEEYEATARTLLQKNPSTKLVLEFLRQVATLLKSLQEKYEFCHRDLKTDNIMYKTEPDGSYRFALIDFGFSCATLDGVKINPSGFIFMKGECARTSRDLTQLCYETLLYNPTLSADLQIFLQLVLTFPLPNGKICKMFENKCPPHKIKTWLDTYYFTAKNGIENPNATPDGLLHAIQMFETQGIQACTKHGFILDPIQEVCVAKPHPVDIVIGVAESPEPAKTDGCPEGKIRNPATKRCVDKHGAIGRKLMKTRKTSVKKPSVQKTKKADCPKGKIRNPATGRCVNENGKIGKKL